MPAPEKTARNEAAGVGREAAERASDVAATVGDQARQVVSEAGAQTRNLLDEGLTQLRDQARDGQRKLAGSVRDLAGQLRRMSDRDEESGLAADLVRQATDRAGQVASWLESREPGELIEEVRGFARRRPGLFLIGAAAAGVLAGRLTRTIMAKGQDSGPGRTSEGSGPQWQVEPPAPPVGQAGGTVSPAVGQVAARPVP